ncbi:MAG: hypothetical protein FRX49_08787 [Trebouxia sp. A1-2]|nr:MAG: hypothetical protein FRX49_08787 [Trebouxia sp. A1-2]
MKSHIPGTSEHKLKKQEENVNQDAKSMQKDEHKLQKQEAKQGAKDDKKLQKEENKLHKQEAKAANAADKASSVHSKRVPALCSQTDVDNQGAYTLQWSGLIAEGSSRHVEQDEAGHHKNDKGRTTAVLAL